MKRLLLLIFISFPFSVQGGKIYWTDRNVGRVQRANLDGSEIETLVEVNATLRGIAIDVPDGKLYFADQSIRKIFRAPIDGGALEELVADLTFPADLTLDLKNRKLYWCDQSRDVIERANLDGSHVETVIETPSPYYLDLDLTGNRLFWGDFAAGNINVVSLAGGDPVNLFTGQPKVRGIKLDLARGDMFWCNRQSNHVQRRKIDGGPIKTVITDLDTPHGLVIDPIARKAYWCDTGTDNHNNGGKAINRADLDIPEPLETVAKLSQPWDADLDLRTTTYAQYVERYFRIERTEEETAPEGDFDRDGFLQILEYGVASHPERKDLVPQVRVEMRGERPAFIYQRFTGVKDLAYQIEVSDDMEIWRSDSPNDRLTGEETLVSLSSGLEEVTLPIIAEGRHLRLRVTLIE